MDLPLDKVRITLADARPELGQVIAGQRPGRLNATDITICDLTGTGAQDTAIANFALARALHDGRGMSYST